MKIRIVVKSYEEAKEVFDQLYKGTYEKYINTKNPLEKRSLLESLKVLEKASSKLLKKLDNPQQKNLEEIN